jgi:hypothetical protein
MLQTTLNDLRDILSAGDPPLIYRLLLINTFALIVFVLRRMSGRKPLNLNAATTVQFALIVANCLVAATGSINPDLHQFGL